MPLVTSTKKLAAEFTAEDRVLPLGVFAFERDTGGYKVGDGETRWTDLEYARAPRAAEPVADAQPAVVTPPAEATLSAPDLMVYNASTEGDQLVVEPSGGFEVDYYEVRLNSGAPVRVEPLEMHAFLNLTTGTSYTVEGRYVNVHGAVSYSRVWEGTTEISA